MEQFVQLTLEEYDKLKNNEYFKEEIAYLNRQLDNLKAKFDSVINDRASIFFKTTIVRTWEGEEKIKDTLIQKYQVVNIPEVDQVVKEFLEAKENWRDVFKKRLKRIRW